jgi:hypothetical protein
VKRWSFSLNERGVVLPGGGRRGGRSFRREDRGGAADGRAVDGRVGGQEVLRSRAAADDAAEGSDERGIVRGTLRCQDLAGVEVDLLQARAGDVEGCLGAAVKEEGEDLPEAPGAGEDLRHGKAAGEDAFVMAAGLTPGNAARSWQAAGAPFEASCAPAPRSLAQVGGADAQVTQGHPGGGGRPCGAGIWKMCLDERAGDPVPLEHGSGELQADGGSAGSRPEDRGKPLRRGGCRR